MDFYAIDQGLRDLLTLYVPKATLDHLTPHFQRLGQLAGGRLNELPRLADRHPPILHPHDRNGYIENRVNPRLIRDAQTGLLWENTSNINALDIIVRAVGKQGAHLAPQSMLRQRLTEAALPLSFRAALDMALDRAIALAERVAGHAQETLARQGKRRPRSTLRPARRRWRGKALNPTSTSDAPCPPGSSWRTVYRLPIRLRRRNNLGKPSPTLCSTAGF